MRILYIYPHPDDESFGPAAVMAKHRRLGHEVYLLTLTKGEATKVRHTLGVSKEEMGEIRYQEMVDVAKTLDLSEMKVLDLPDSGLKEMDPRVIEQVVADEIRRIRPHVISSYPVHGISGFHDHLVMHAVVKRVFCVLREELPELQRLAMHTLTEEMTKPQEGTFHLSSSTPEEIDCIEEVSEEDMEANREALLCYKTYLETIKRSGVMEKKGAFYHFEIYDEAHDPPLTDLFDGINEG